MFYLDNQVSINGNEVQSTATTYDLRTALRQNAINEQDAIIETISMQVTQGER